VTNQLEERRANRLAVKPVQAEARLLYQSCVQRKHQEKERMVILHTWSRLPVQILVVMVGGNDAGQNSLRSGFRSLLRSFSALVTGRREEPICVYQPPFYRINVKRGRMQRRSALIYGRV
jgi:hypothetical protein